MSKVNHSERKHALLSASGASRWLNCTPSARLEESFESIQTSYAAEGTLAHEFADIGIRFAASMMPKREYNKAIDNLRKHYLYAADMEEEVQKHIDYVLEQFTEAKRLTKDAVLVVEEKTDLTDYIEEGFGTCDSIIIADGVMEVIDLKYGKGVRVSSKDNSQLKLYGLGALRKYELMFDIKVIRLTIVQPRLDSISSWEISVDDLREWGDEVVKPKAEEAYSGEGTFTPGEWCRFCKAKAKCKAIAEENLKIAKLDFADLAVPNVSERLSAITELTEPELLDIFEKSSQIEDWLASVKAHIMQLALEGKEWEGYKLVEGKSNRKWSNEEEVAEILENADYTEAEIFNKKLKGITIIEKAIGKVNFTSLLSNHVIKPQGAPTLVPLSDKRPALGNDQAAEDFKDLD